MYNNFVEEPATAWPVFVVSNTNLLQLLQRHRLHDELVQLLHTYTSIYTGIYKEVC